MNRGFLATWLLTAVTGGALAADPRVNAARAVAFNRDIRPLLADRCFACHGPDARQRQANLRLDVKDGVYARRADGITPVVPGDLAASELYRRVTSADPAERMPPPESGKSLSPGEIDLFRRWIEAGAPWQGHWAYIPPARPEVPEVGDDHVFARNPIDHFVLARLREEGLEPSPAADRITLIRRLSFDLTGLPPDAERAAAFARDDSPGAYEALVDELLASPHHGERLAMWWLDLVRYADSVGYHGDQPITNWPYRDYIIGAFNADLPFDRFTLEQIAGDLLPGATQEQKVAASYNRLNMMSAEGGGQDKEYHAKYASDRVRATSGAWLGATLGCAECHDHKFDPYTTRDFYSFAAFFADVAERGIYLGSHDNGMWGEMLSVPDAGQAAELARLEAAIAAARQALEAPSAEVAAAQAEWERSLSRVQWTVVKPASAVSAGGATLAVLEDGSVLASGENPEKDAYTLTAESPLEALTAIRVEVLPDDSLPRKGSGRAGNGNFVLTEVDAKLQPPGGGAPAAKLAFASASASFEQLAGGEKLPYGRWSAAAAIDGDVHGPSFGWAALEEFNRPQELVLEVGEGPERPRGGLLTLTLAQGHGTKHNLGRFRIAVTAGPRPVRAMPSLPEKVRGLLAIEPAARTPAQVAEIAVTYRTIAPALAPARDRLAALERERAGIEKAVPRIPAAVAMKEPRTMRVLPRGNWMDDSGAVVSPAVPAFLPQPKVEGARASRVDLGRWLASRENPLAARVVANRLWKLFFGAGLSRRLDDLGAQGEPPSHHELLDWLAVEFMDGGWSIRHLVRVMVTSGTYQQSSLASTRLRDRDPYNRLLARQGRFRLDAEMVRDNALAASGLLVRDIGGPSVKPYQPRGYWAYLNFPMREWENDAGEKQYRRGLYTHWQRQYLHPSLLAFDAPTREECAADRPRSNTPLQALVLLNDPTFVEAARVFAARIVAEGGRGDGERLDWAFRRALSRPPRPEEARLITEMVAKHREEYRRDPAAAGGLLTVGLQPVPEDADAIELAAWTSAARALLNLHESITRS
jgi:hypothetical protein